MTTKYEARGLTVGETVKVVRGNRYLYARVWDREAQTQKDIYIGPVRPKTLRGLLTAEDVEFLRKQFRNAEDTRHRKLADVLSKVLEAYRAEE